jgi:integrase
MALTAKEIDALKPLPGAKSATRHADGDGLYLQLEASGKRVWVLRYRSPTAKIVEVVKDDGVVTGKRTVGKPRVMGLGSYGAKGDADKLTLAQARDAATTARALIKSGVDPLDIPEPPPADEVIPTYRSVCNDYIETQEAGWRNPKTAARWRSNLALHSGPLVDLPIDGVKVEHVLTALQPIWTAKAFTAQKFREQIVAVLDHAKAKGLRSGDNPAAWAGNLKTMLSKPAKLQHGHHKALNWKDVADFMPKLQAVTGIGALALEFTILTASRSGETRGATWGEFDLTNATWTIPGNRMKMGVMHQVPLSPRAIEILKHLEPLKRSADSIVFPGQRRGTALSDMSLSAVLRRMNVDVTVHGFRSTFRDWSGDTGAAPREVAEAALAHQVGDQAERAYSRSSALERRRVLMSSWAEFCGRPAGGNVVQLKRA